MSSLFDKYINGKDVSETQVTKDKSFLKRMTTGFMVATMALSAIVGTVNKLENNRTEREQTAIQRILKAGDLSNTANINYQNKQDVINHINNITKEYYNIDQSIKKQYTHIYNREVFMKENPDIGASVNGDSVDEYFNSVKNETRLQRMFILNYEMKNIFDNIKNKPEFNDIREDVKVKTGIMSSDYNSTISDKNLHYLLEDRDDLSYLSNSHIKGNELSTKEISNLPDYAIVTHDKILNHDIINPDQKQEVHVQEVKTPQTPQQPEHKGGLLSFSDALLQIATATRDMGNGGQTSHIQEAASKTLHEETNNFNHHTLEQQDNYDNDNAQKPMEMSMN